MAWARVIRGTSSSANAVTPRFARAAMPSGFARGSRRPTSNCPFRRRSKSAAASPATARTRSTTSALANTSSASAARPAPFSTYAESGKPASSPAPRSSSTSRPIFLSCVTLPGTSATRRSPFSDSFGTPAIMAGSVLEARYNRQPMSHHRSARFRFCPECGGPLAERELKDGDPARLVCIQCGFVSYLDPKLAACTISMLGGGVVLLRRAVEPQKGKWVFPGGFVDRGETVPGAAVRETWEEVGLRVTLTGILDVYSFAG